MALHSKSHTRFWQSRLLLGINSGCYLWSSFHSSISNAVIENTATQTFKYDHLNRLTQAVAPNSYGTQNYSYSTLGNISTKEGVTYTYSKVNAGPHAVTSLSDGTTLTYDLNGNMSTMVKTGDSKAFTYDVENRLIDVKKNGVTVGQYFYDGDGGRTAKISYTTGLAGNNTCFLAGTKITMGDGTTKSIEDIKVGDSVVSYDVKQMANVTAKVTEMFGGETAKEYLLVNGHLKVTPNHQFYSMGEWIEIGKMNVGDLLFDQDGNEVAINKIEKVESQNSIQVYNLEVEGEHNYYADGILVHNKLSYNPPAVSGVPVSSGVITRYVGSLSEETKGAWVNHVFLGSTKIATVTSNEVRYYFQDHLGSANVVTNSAGSQIELIEYKPFGEFSRRDQFGTSNAAWYYFTGKPLDDETGLIYFGARYYSPVLGRFLTPDTIVQAPMNPQTLNRYSYANNNPINNIDPDGHSWFRNLIGKVIGGISAAVMFFASGGNIAVAANTYNTVESFITPAANNNWAVAGRNALNSLAMGSGNPFFMASGFTGMLSYRAGELGYNDLSRTLGYVSMGLGAVGTGVEIFNFFSPGNVSANAQATQAAQSQIATLSQEQVASIINNSVTNTLDKANAIEVFVSKANQAYLAAHDGAIAISIFDDPIFMLAGSAKAAGMALKGGASLAQSGLREAYNGLRHFNLQLGQGGFARIGNSAANAKFDAVAKALKMSKEIKYEFRLHIEGLKQSVGKGGANNFGYQQLIRHGKEFMETYGKGI